MAPAIQTATQRLNGVHRFKVQLIRGIFPQDPQYPGLWLN